MWLTSCASSRDVPAELGHLYHVKAQVLGRASHSNHSWQVPEEEGDKEISRSTDLSLGTRWCVYIAAASVAVLAAPLQFSHRNMDVKIDLRA